MYLLDTNVISEMIKRQPEKAVIDWLLSIDSQQFFLSVLTLGEIRKGVEKIGDPIKKQKMIQWLEIDLVRRFQSRVISIDAEIADKWGYLQAARSLPVIDSLMAASALVYNYKLVTRNAKDFKGIIGLEVINPWEN
jgi:predicted nucleic acid-binding protein